MILSQIFSLSGFEHHKLTCIFITVLQQAGRLVTSLIGGSNNLYFTFSTAVKLNSHVDPAQLKLSTLDWMAKGPRIS